MYQRKEDKLYIYSPYNTSFINIIKQLGGTWNGKAWVVESQLEDQVKKHLLTYYAWAAPGAATIKVSMKAIDGYKYRDIRLGKVKVVTRTNRDQSVRFIDGFHYSGGEPFPNSGGSMKNPDVTPYDDTEITGDIPVDFYNQLSENEKKKLTIIQGIGKAELEKEKAMLLERIDEIDMLLNA